MCSITIFRRKKQLKNIVFDFLTISPYLYKTANRWRISPKHDCSSQLFLIQHFHIMVIVIVIIVIITLLLIIISSSITGHLHIYSKTGNCYPHDPIYRKAMINYQHHHHHSQQVESMQHARASSPPPKRRSRPLIMRQLTKPCDLIGRATSLRLLSLVGPR